LQVAIEVDDAGRLTVRDNVLSGNGTTGTAIHCLNTVAPVRVKDNIIKGFTTANSGCNDAGGNDITP
jgi:hypothetical protein